MFMANLSKVAGFTSFAQKVQFEFNFSEIVVDTEHTWGTFAM